MVTCPVTLLMVATEGFELSNEMVSFRLDVGAASVNDGEVVVKLPAGRINAPSVVAV